MSVSPRDLTSPAGELDRRVLFPGESATAFDARLAAYLTQGKDKASALSGTDQDDAVTAWAYHRAYNEVATRMSALPTTASLSDQGSIGYLLTQARDMQARADAWKATYDELIDSVVVVATETFGTIRSLR